jgi:hypothetical protein
MTVKEFFKSVLRKIGSTKMWITVWAMAMATRMIWEGRDGVALVILLAAPLSYMGLNVLQDFIFRGK